MPMDQVHELGRVVLNRPAGRRPSGVEPAANVELAVNLSTKQRAQPAPGRQLRN
jgi:hypothetical protein